MLTIRRVKANQPARSARAIGAAFAVSVFTLLVGAASATAQEIESSGCIGTRYSFNCTDRFGPAGNPFVRVVPHPADDAAIKRAQDRDRHWATRCRPTMTPDRYGVSRYSYAAPGCEFGVGEE